MASSPSANPPGRSFGEPLANWLMPGYLIVVLIGFAVFRNGHVSDHGQEFSHIRSLFTSVNAATLTGFQAANAITELRPLGKVVILLLIISGSLLSLIIGSLAVVRIVGMKYSDGQVILAAFVAEAAALLVGGVALHDADRSWAQSFFTAASCFGNCGLHLGRAPDLYSPQTHAMMLPLAFLGGLGLPVLMDLCALIARHRPLSQHSRAVIGVSLWLYVGGFVLLLILGFLGRGWHFDWNRASLIELIATSSALSLDSRSAGIPLFLASFSPAIQWVVIALMFIGASPAGTGGGLKTTTMFELFAGVKKSLSGSAPGRTFGVAGVWLGIYLAILLAALLGISCLSPQAVGEQTLFNIVSAVGNVGFSGQPIPDDRSVMYVLSFAMLAGRIAPLMILWWMAQTTRDAEVAIG